MIFNPLFLTESGNTQILSPKSGKLSNNKYLFSDIVKVVMNPNTEPKKLTSETENILGGNVGLLLENSKNPVKIKLKILSDTDNEEAKLGLAEILPDEIAQLLTSDQFDVDEKAISYISKELLNGELQSFVNNLVGEELIENNISNESGLLLSLEDSKSAVNLELAKESGKKSTSDKIVVQTLVIPEKAKLLSLVDKRTNGNIIDIKNASLNNSSSIMENNNSELVKPTLSVYSFNYGADNLESLTKNIKSNSGNKHNLSLLGNKNLEALNVEAKKVPLEKISFVPSELKKEQTAETNIKTVSKLKGTKISDLKLFETKQPIVEKDFSVSKITIVKKNGEVNISDKQLLSNNQLLGSKIKAPTTEVESVLKRIDFTKLKNKENPIPVSENSKDATKIITKPENVIKNNNAEEVTENIKVTGKTNVNRTQFSENIKNITINKDVKITSDVKIINNEKVNTPVDVSKENINIDVKKNGSNNLVKPKQGVREKVTVNSETEKPSNVIKNNITHNTTLEKELTNTTKVEVNNNSSQLTKSVKKVIVKNPRTNISTTTSENKINTKQVNTEEKIIEPKNVKNSENTQKNNSELKSTQSKVVEPSAQQASTPNKDVIEIKDNSGPKLQDAKNEKTNVKIEIPVLTTKNPIEEKIVAEKAENKIITQPIENQVTAKKVVANKKVSVKVKSGIKSISDKADSKSNAISNSAITENNNTNSSNESSNNSFSSSKEIAMPNSALEFKGNSDNIFSQALNKEGVTLSGVTGDKLSEVEDHSNRKMVKSAEVIKELTKFISKQEKGSLSFDIRPEQLGKMKITLDTTENVIKARIEVESEQAKQLIERNIDKLHQDLSENGLKLNSLNISLGNSKQHKTEQEEMKNKQFDSQDFEQAEESEEKEQKKTLGYNTYEYIA